MLSVLNMIPRNGLDQDGLVMFSIKSKHREVVFFHVVNDFFSSSFLFFFYLFFLNRSLTCSAQRQCSLVSLLKDLVDKQ